MKFFREGETRLSMKIVNCALATQIKPAEPERMCCGSPGYTAPEVFTSEGYGLKVDIFNCGIIMYML